MASAATPRRSATRRAGRASSRKRRHNGPGSDRPEKKTRYNPGGLGGGSRFTDDKGNETPSGEPGPGEEDRAGGAGLSSTRRISQRQPTGSPPTVTSRPRRTPAPPRPRFSTAGAAAASAMVNSEGYKPREERSWEEFHPDLDIEAELQIFNAEEVDSTSRTSNPVTPLRQGLTRSLSEQGALSHVKSALLEHRSPSINDMDEAENPFAVAPNMTPIKRRPGRPPKNQMLSGLGSPPAPRPMPLPTHNPKERLNLLKPNYRRVETFKKFEEAKNVGVNFVDKSMAKVGYQETDRFIRPSENYIRACHTSFEDELEIAQALRDGEGEDAMPERVEYDMDEQDERWLDKINAERLADSAPAISPAHFEITMTQIEKEWHALEKRIPKPTPKQPQTHRPRSGSAAAVNGEPGHGEEQDSKCAICDDGDCENTNAIVFCDGCDLAVHQECYGVPFIPEGQWHCRKCQLLGKNNVTCIFCPNTEGAFKQTNSLKWAHLLCAIWIPETSIGNMTFMEPIMDVEKVPRQRWRLNCYICQQKMGACIQCANKNCYLAFHVTCARRGQLFLRMKNNGTPIDHPNLKGYCHKHVPSDWRKERHVDQAIIDAFDYYRRAMKGRRWADSQTAALTISGTAQGHEDEEEEPENVAVAAAIRKKRQSLQKRIWRLPSGAPIIPHAVFESLEHSLARFNLRKRKEFIAEACKYWSLKREARRGASLLKRLQLNMESFSAMELTRRNYTAMGAAGRQKLQQHIEFAEMIEKEMAHVTKLAAMIKEKEYMKLSDVDELMRIIDAVYTPMSPLILAILDKAISLDDSERLYFTAGIEVLRKRAMRREFVSIIPFTTDLVEVFRQKLDFVQENVGRARFTPEQKALKHRATIMIGKLRPMLVNAARKEAELGLKGEVGADEDVQRVLAIVQTATKGGPGSVHPSVADQEEDGFAPNGHNEADAEGDIEMPDAATSRDSDAPNNIGGPTIHEEIMKNGIKVHLDEVDAVPPDETDESVPALSNSGSTNPSHGQVDPPTPPRHPEKDLLAPLSHGGVPWYLEAFQPEGTTVYDEAWGGRAVLRALSEELSELDDEEMNGLINADVHPEKQGGNGVLINGDAVAEEEKMGDTLKPVVPVKKKPRRKRAR